MAGVQETVSSDLAGSSVSTLHVQGNIIPIVFCIFSVKYFYVVHMPILCTVEGDTIELLELLMSSLGVCWSRTATRKCCKYKT